MSKRDLVSAASLSNGDVTGILNVADSLERLQEQGKIPPLLKGKYLALIFDETSLRTRAAFQRGMEDLGGHVHVYSGEEIRLGPNAKKQEHLPDLAKVLGGFYDGVLSRIYDHSLQEQFSKLLPIPFINGMCNAHHPTQALCDMLTIRRKFGSLDGIKISFVGDATNVATSIAQLAFKVGARFTLVCPNEAAFPESDGVETPLSRTADLRLGLQNADVVITDTWVPMGRDAERPVRIQQLSPYRVTEELMSNAAKHAVFMHNLPAIRGEEVTAEVIDGPQSVVYEEAVARLHIARAVLLWAMHPCWSDVVSEFGRLQRHGVQE